MRILLLNRAFYPDSVATSQYVTDIARDLDARGHEVTVICGRRDHTTPEETHPRFSTLGGIRIHRVPSTGFGKANRAARILDAVSFDIALLWRLVRLSRQDAVIAFTSPPLAGLWGALVARLWRARFIHWIMNINHEIAIELGYIRRAGLLARLLRLTYRRTLASADLVVVMDRWMKACVEREGLAHNIAVIPLWPIHEQDSVSDLPAAIARFRKQHGLLGKFVVLHSGNLSYIHPLETILDAATRLRDDPSVVFVFIGYGVRERDIDARVLADGLPNIVKLPYQPRESLATSLGIADLHLVIMGDAAAGLAHSSKIYSILASGEPYVFIGPRDSHIVSDVLSVCPGGRHVENGGVEGLLSAIRSARKLTQAERARIQRTNRSIVAARFDRDRSLTRFAGLVVGERVSAPAEPAAVDVARAVNRQRR